MNVWKRTAILCVIWLFVTVSFCTVHLSADFECFISWARQTHNNNLTGIVSLSETWELKGVLFRAIVLLFYDITFIFSYSDITLEFQYIFKTLGCIMLNAILASAVYVIPSRYVSGYKKKDIFFFAGIFLFGVHWSSHLQPEFIAVFFLLLATALYLEGNIISKILAGVLVGLTFFLKSPIPIVGGSLMAVSILLKETELKKEFFNILPLGFSMLLTITLGLTALKLYAPQEIEDMLNAGVFQHTLLSCETSIGKVIYMFCKNTLLRAWYIPIFVLSLLMVWCNLNTKKWNSSLWYVLAFLFPMLYLIISNCYFPYHYYLAAFPALFVLLHYIKFNNVKLFTSRNLILGVSAVLLSLAVNPIAYYFPFRKSIIPLSCFLLCSSSFKKFRYSSCVALACFLIFTYLVNDASISYSAIRGNAEYRAVVSESTIESIHYGNKLGDGPILFLDSGTASFFITNKSYIRYFYPLLLNRWVPLSRNAEKPMFRNILSRIQNYENEYVLMDERWIPPSKWIKIDKLLETRYHKIGTVNCPTFGWGLFSRSQFRKMNISVYKKNEAKQ